MLYAVTRIWAAFCFGKWQQSVLGIIGWFILHWNVKLEVPKWCLSLRGKGPPREEWLQRVWFILSVFMFTGCFISCWDLWVVDSHLRRSQITWRSNKPGSFQHAKGDKNNRTLDGSSIGAFEHGCCKQEFIASSECLSGRKKMYSMKNNSVLGSHCPNWNFQGDGSTYQHVNCKQDRSLIKYKLHLNLICCTYLKTVLV